ncbi:DUF4249 domain-containing protein [Parabacteroides sp. PF5-6]|uniref:DUF4249 domain-containing protein n=1 Tax=Parabacteroides sp. PF5-6 TaxID=1742403 RepID=UPI002405037C|nr:DUF4249 domain-containing protein [Parabacteroides sp. PF5-6]MDF9829971.1 hypothetical protein [Parabacteroides sp. PF5-6]
MKRMDLYSLVFVFSLVLLGACQWEVDVEDLRKDPRLVLNAVVMAHQPVTASVSRTWFFTEDNPNVTFRDAEVHLYINGQYQETMAWVEGDKRYNSQGLYQAEYVSKVGERVAVIAQKKGFATVSAEVVVPTPCQQFQATEQITELHYEDTFDASRLLSISFRDNADRADYYLCFCELGYPVWDEEKGEFTGEYSWTNLDADYTEEPLFMGQLSAFEKILGYDWLSGKYGRVFTDEQINGKEYTIRLPFRQSTYGYYYYYDGYENWELEISALPRLCRVSLYTISESYYRYLKTLIEMEDDSLQQMLIESGLAEPISLYCNIDGGLGILGACNGQSVTFELSVAKPRQPF